MLHVVASLSTGIRRSHISLLVKLDVIGGTMSVVGGTMDSIYGTMNIVEGTMSIDSGTMRFIYGAMIISGGIVSNGRKVVEPCKEP